MTPPPSGMEANLAAAVASPPLSLPSAPGECLDALECEPVSTRNQHHQDPTKEGEWYQSDQEHMMMQDCALLIGGQETINEQLHTSSSLALSCSIRFEQDSSLSSVFFPSSST